MCNSIHFKKSQGRDGVSAEYSRPWLAHHYLVDHHGHDGTSLPGHDVDRSSLRIVGPGLPPSGFVVAVPNKNCLHKHLGSASSAELEQRCPHLIKSGMIENVLLKI